MVTVTDHEVEPELEEFIEPEKQLLPGRLVTLESLPHESKTRYWVIKFRILNKLPVRSLFGGTSRMISFELGDATGIMKACAFDHEVDRFDKGFHIGKTYWLSDATVRLTRDAHQNSNKYEIKMTKYTKFEMCKDDASVPDIEFNFKPLNQITKVAPGEVVDIIGVCTRASELFGFDDGPDKTKHRRIYLISPDSPKSEVNVDIWGKIAEDFNASNHPVVAIKNCKKSTVDIKAQMFLDKVSVFIVNPPKLAETKKLKVWYNEFFKDTPKEMDNSQVCSEVTVESKFFTMGVTRVDTLKIHKTVFLKTIATVIETDPQYTATLTCRDCNRLVHDLNLNKLVCCACGFVDGAILRRLSTRLRFGDDKCSMWVTVNDEHLRKLLKITDDGYVECHDTKHWQTMCALKGQTFYVKLKFVKTPEFDDSKMQCSIVEIDPFVDQALQSLQATSQ